MEVHQDNAERGRRDAEILEVCDLEEGHVSCSDGGEGLRRERPFSQGFLPSFLLQGNHI